ncbi:MAG TPA: V-type ATP synthase subunit D [Acidimicrobiales bacterium]|nr:V-type ATP synthase subunit D [Acidimicrobiales bacterium]
MPPGRAGLLWLRSRLTSARRGAELLDRKRLLLRRERQRLESIRLETDRRWAAACSEAEHWGARATELGGASDVALAADALDARAAVDVPWRSTMGVRHPGEPRCELGILPPVAAAAAGGAVAPAAAAYRRALEAGVAHAAADASFRIIDAELRATERRLRALERRRLPALENELRSLVLRLDELEREERVATRWAQRRRGRDLLL